MQEKLNKFGTENGLAAKGRMNSAPNVLMNVAI